MSDALQIAFGISGLIGGLSGIFGAVIVYRARRIEKRGQ